KPSPETVGVSGAFATDPGTTPARVCFDSDGKAPAIQDAAPIETSTPTPVTNIHVRPDPKRRDHVVRRSQAFIISPCIWSYTWPRPRACRCYVSHALEENTASIAA